MNAVLLLKLHQNRIIVVQVEGEDQWNKEREVDETM